MIEYTCKTCGESHELEGTFDPGYPATFDDPGESAMIEGFEFDWCCQCGESILYEDVLASELERRTP